MKTFIRTIICLFIAIAISGCKVEIFVPVGGDVTTPSGAYQCYSGQTCVVNVRDIYFDETFTAQPKSGYQFVGWKKKERAFCAEDTKPCHLYTSLLAGIPELLGFLDSNETFYLEPVFERTTSATNRLRIYQPGNVLVLQGTFTAKQGTQTISDNITIRYEFFTSTYTYADKRVLALRTKISSPKYGDIGSDTQHFYQDANGSWYDLVDSDGDYYYDSGVGKYGVLAEPSPMVASSSYVIQYQLADATNLAIAMETGRKTLLVLSPENVTVPLGSYRAFPVVTEDRSSYTRGTPDRYTGDYDESESTDWISPEKGLIRLKASSRSYRYYGELFFSLSVDVKATSTNY